MIDSQIESNPYLDIHAWTNTVQAYFFIGEITHR